MTITKALIVADPWIGYLLDGSKTWEMRSSGSSHRGWFGLIRKGTGAVHGVARLVEVGAPLSPQDMIANFERHRIPEQMIRSGEVAKWNTPWKLADIRRLAEPVPYRHKSGAVTWVALDPSAIAGIARQLGGIAPAIDASKPNAASPDSETVSIDVRQRGSKLSIGIEWDDDAPKPPAAAAPIPSRPRAGVAQSPASGGGLVIGQVKITQGNIDNNHIYLRSFFDRFPKDVVGGSNRHEKAVREVMVDWGGHAPVHTDLDGSKRFFRSRGWIRTFFEQNAAEAGDTVLVEEIAPYSYRVCFAKDRMPL